MYARYKVSKLGDPSIRNINVERSVFINSFLDDRFAC